MEWKGEKMMQGQLPNGDQEKLHLRQLKKKGGVSNHAACLFSGTRKDPADKKRSEIKHA